MTDELVAIESHPNGVAVLRLQNGKVNALSTTLLGQLATAAQSLIDASPSVVVVAGSERMFAAGADISEFNGPVEAAKVGEAFKAALDAVAAIPRITIAAIDGVALGGGCELALACDFRVITERSKLGQPEILLGIIPGGGGTQRLARLVGASRAKDLIVTGRQVGAEEALAMGLVNRVAAEGSAFEAAMAWAQELSAGPVVAQGLAKAAIDGGLEGSLDDGLNLEIKLFGQVFSTEDSQIGVASFREHGPGKAIFTGR